MNLFFDTSALVKFFHEEVGTETVSKVILDPKNSVWILELARLEFLSAVFRRFRTRELDEDRLNTAIDSFEKQVANWNVEPLGRAVIEEAATLMKSHAGKHGLKALDAMHLGAFSLISEADWALVAAAGLERSERFHPSYFRNFDDFHDYQTDFSQKNFNCATGCDNLIW